LLLFQVVVDRPCVFGLEKSRKRGEGVKE
jgi:hypothetical protein